MTVVQFMLTLNWRTPYSLHYRSTEPLKSPLKMNCGKILIQNKTMMNMLTSISSLSIERPICRIELHSTLQPSEHQLLVPMMSSGQRSVPRSLLIGANTTTHSTLTQQYHYTTKRESTSSTPSILAMMPQPREVSWRPRPLDCSSSYTTRILTMNTIRRHLQSPRMIMMILTDSASSITSGRSDTPPLWIRSGPSLPQVV